MPQCDCRAIEFCLQIIAQNRGKDGFPENPVICIYTTYKEHALIFSGMDNPQKGKYLERVKANIDGLIDQLASAGKTTNTARCYWIPEKFVNKMLEVKNLFDAKQSNTTTPKAGI